MKKEQSIHEAVIVTRTICRRRFRNKAIRRKIYQFIRKFYRLDIIWRWNDELKGEKCYEKREDNNNY